MFFKSYDYYLPFNRLNALIISNNVGGENSSRMLVGERIFRFQADQCFNSFVIFLVFLVPLLKLSKLSLTNRFHVAVYLFSDKSQKTSKCGKNMSDTLGYRLLCHFFETFCVSFSGARLRLLEFKSFFTMKVVFFFFFLLLEFVHTLGKYVFVHLIWLNVFYILTTFCHFR